MSDVVSIDPRFHSWDGVAHGGYVAGLVGGRVGPGAEVTLRQAAPFQTPLAIEGNGDGQLELTQDGEVIARAASADTHVELPEPVSFETAAKLEWNHDTLNEHPTPHCFCCGYERAKGDGLRVFPAPIPGRKLGQVVAPWVPDPAFADGDGALRPEFVWAALDCPGFWGMALSISHMPNVITIRLAASLMAPVMAEERHVVMGWPISHRGRKFLCGSAIFGPKGDVRAVGRATWLKVNTLPEAGV
jgi:hypothetical protein